MIRTSSKNQSGNMLIYILGAIFLMGLLVVLVKGNIQPGAGIDAEQDVIKVTEVRKYASELERAVSFILQNGASESDIRFANSGDAAYGTVGDGPARQVFDPAGGSAEFKAPPVGIQTTTTPWFFSASNLAMGIGKDLILGNSVELIAFLPNVTKGFCLQVNNSVGITNPAGNPPKEASNVELSTKFVGTYTYTHWVDTTGDYTKGQPEGCFEGNSGSATTGLTGAYYYYKVLLAR